MKSVLFIIQTDPYASSTVSDAIDMAYAAAVFDVDVAVLFVGDGIACLRQGHDSKVLQRKSIEKKILLIWHAQTKVVSVLPVEVRDDAGAVVSPH